MTSRQSIADFYDAKPLRRESEEVTYGDGWTDPDDANATYRLNYVLDTGELYLVREPHPGGVLARYLDQLNVDQADVDELTVEVIGVFSPDVVESSLAGWSEAMEDRDSLRWLRQRLAVPR